MEDSLFSARLNNHDILINGLVKSQTKLDDNMVLLTGILKQVVENQEKHDAEMKRINDRLDAQEGQIKLLIEQFMSGFNLESLRNVVEEFNAKFDQVFERLDANDAKFDQMMERLDANDRKFTEQDVKFDQITEELHGIRSILEAIQRKLDI